MASDEDLRYDVGRLNADTLRKLEESGLRMTVQRRRIIDVLMNSKSTSPKALWYEAKERVPDLGIATVYRLINRLEQIGILSRSRALDMRPDVPRLGSVTDAGGHVIEGTAGLTLAELVREGLAARGALRDGQEVSLLLNGSTIEVKVQG
ncbi:MAG: transcriptional repressor [Succinivibrionaceae bacterium]|nr:transcriptional repressor [Succinivibrionaceae bacterium]